MSRMRYSAVTVRELMTPADGPVVHGAALHGAVGVSRLVMRRTMRGWRPR